MHECECVSVYACVCVSMCMCACVCVWLKTAAILLSDYTNNAYLSRQL